MGKIDSRTLPVDALNERRRRAVKMRLDGVTLQDTAARCQMSRTTVIAALKASQAGGWTAVDVARPGHPEGTGRTLTAEQEREVQRLIRDRAPDQLKMGLYLGRWGFTPHKPMKKAFEGALHSAILIDFLKRLVKDASRTIYLILDNLRVHHSKPVKTWLAERKHEIEVFYLPSCSAELNPTKWPRRAPRCNA